MLHNTYLLKYYTTHLSNGAVEPEEEPRSPPQILDRLLHSYVFAMSRNLLQLQKLF